MTRLRIAALILAVVTGARAQKPPAFDVASVKANHSPDMCGMHVQFLPGGRLSIENMPLFIVIALAYDVPFNPSVRLSGVPDWTRSDKFDIEARAETLPPDLVGAADIPCHQVAGGIGRGLHGKAV